VAEAPRDPGCSCCRALEHENQRLRERVAQLDEELAAMQKANQELLGQVAQLRALLEQERRAGKRQAAPFSKGEPRKQPRRPGRKPGAAYGRKAHRPRPQRVDEVVDAPLPATCPACAGAIAENEVAQQYQVDLPPRLEPWVRQVNVHVGCCQACGRRVQGRHPLQTSDALGAAASQLGPRLLALAADLKLVMGLSYGKICTLFASLFGVVVTPGGLALALQRLGRAAAPTYEALKDAVRSADVVSPDETGWRVAGRSAWLWAFVTTMVTVYAIEPGRGYLEAVKVLGEEFSGTLARDGWAPYRKFTRAKHQTCVAHLLRRCKEILDTAQRGAARLPHAVRRILKQALLLRDRRDADAISPHGLRVATGRLRAAMNRYLRWRPSDEENRKLVKHLNKEANALFTFLDDPAVPATNHLAERAIRPAVVTRKTCGGGNRDWSGATMLATLLTILRTSRQQGYDPLPILANLLLSPQPAVAHILVPAAPQPSSSAGQPPARQPPQPPRSRKPR